MILQGTIQMKHIKAYLLIFGFFCLINNACTMEEREELPRGVAHGVLDSFAQLRIDGKSNKKRRRKRNKKTRNNEGLGAHGQGSSKTQDTGLFLLIHEKKLEEFEEMFSSGVEVDGYRTPIEKLLYLRNSNMDTFLHVAIRLELLSFVEVILKAIQGQPCRDELSKFAFYKVRARGAGSLSKKVIQKKMKPLIDSGCWINGIANKDGQTPYGLARALLKKTKGAPKLALGTKAVLHAIRLAALESIVRSFQEFEALWFAQRTPRGTVGAPPIPLFAASYQCNGLALQFLLDHKADLNALNDDGQTVIGYLCTSEQDACFGNMYDRLLVEDVDCNIPDYDGNTSIMLAAAYEDYCLFKLLLRQDDLVIDQHNDKGENIFHIIAKMQLDCEVDQDHSLNHPEVFEDSLELLLKKVNQSNKRLLIQQDSLGRAPLHYLVEKGFSNFSLFVDKVKKLFPKKNDHYLSIKDNEGFSVLHRSIVTGDSLLVSWCLGAGACIEDTDDGQSCPSLVRAVIDDDLGKLDSCLQIVRMLEIHSHMKEEGLNVDDSVDDDGNTFLHLAAKEGQVDVIGMLLYMGADVHKKNIAGKAAKCYAPLGSKSAQLLALGSIEGVSPLLLYNFKL
jgi:ankyrin repeat protein